MSDFYKSVEQLLDSIEDEEWRRIKKTSSYNEIANLFVKEELAILIIKLLEEKDNKA